VTERLIGRTWRRIWWQTSAVVATAVIAVAGVAAGLVLNRQHDAARRTVEQAMVDALAGAEVTPPTGVRVSREVGGVTTHSTGAPDDPVDRAAVREVASGGASAIHEIRQGHTEFLVDTRRSGPVTVQVALDLTTQENEQHRLTFALLGAGGLGLALAVAAGGLIARRAIQPLGVALERQRRFVADASHELRTPLTQLHTRAQLLARMLDASDHAAQSTEDARQLVRGLQQLGDIVEEMLLAAQLRSEPQLFGPVDLDPLAEEVVAAHGAQARERDSSLQLHRDDGSHVVRGTAGALRRTIAALIDNALAHAPGGHVEVDLRRDGDHVVCTVRDDGVGLEPGDASRLFERFARGSLGEGRRFGLGLALVRETVQAHGGTVAAAGAPGQGATFTVRLPAWSGS
jgi:signal transduction histidine kinase